MYVLITESLCRRPWLRTARDAIAGGADCLQLREKELDDAPDEARAERAGFMAKSGRSGVSDLLGLLENKTVKLEDLDEKLLPDDLRKMSAEERTKHIATLLEKRKALRAQGNPAYDHQ